MIRRFRFSLPFLLSSASMVAVIPVLTPLFAVVQAQTPQTTATPQTQKEQVPAKSSHVQTAQVAGNWQVAWQGRLGTEHCTVHFEQDGTKLTGTLQDLRGVMPLSGTVDEKKISFEVQFGGPRPFTTRFTGTANGDKIEGTSQAVGVEGGGAFLGHAGEIVHPEHPWTAKRVAEQPSQATQAGSNSNPPGRN